MYRQCYNALKIELIYECMAIIVTARRGGSGVYGEVYCIFAVAAAQCRVPLSGTTAFWRVIIAINPHTFINFSSILADIIM